MQQSGQTNWKMGNKHTRAWHSFLSVSTALVNVSYQTFASHTLEKSLIFNNHDFIKIFLAQILYYP